MTWIFLQLSNINKRITNNNNFDIYVINLKKRKDRYISVTSGLNELNIFNINIFEAVENSQGYIGCALSHLSLIKFALEENKDYIIIAEDDIILNSNITREKLLEILIWLKNNLDKWDIFNGTPTFWDKKDNMNLVTANESINKDLVYLNWGQNTGFIIYNKRSYIKLLN